MASVVWFLNAESNGDKSQASKGLVFPMTSRVWRCAAIGGLVAVVVVGPMTEVAVAAPSGAAGRSARVFISPGQDGWLVQRRAGGKLTQSTAWVDSEGACFVGTRRKRDSKHSYRGTMSLLPGAVAATVRLKWRTRARPHQVVLTKPSSRYPASRRTWFPTTTARLRTQFSLPPSYRPVDDLAACRSSVAARQSKSWATSHEPTSATRRKLNTGPVTGCRRWEGTIADTRTVNEFAYRIRARCHGEPLRLHFRQSFNTLRYRGSGRLQGHTVRYSGSLDDSTTEPVKLRLGSRHLGRYGDGSWHSGSSHAGFSLGRTSFYCIREDLDGRRRWSVRMATMSMGGSHYHGAPTRSERRGLPFLLCATLLQTSENLLPTNW